MNRFYMNEGEMIQIKCGKMIGHNVHAEQPVDGHIGVLFRKWPNVTLNIGGDLFHYFCIC